MPAGFRRHLVGKTPRNVCGIAQIAEWLACWTQAQKGLGSNRNSDAVLGKLFTPIVPLFTFLVIWSVAVGLFFEWV